MGFKIAPKRRGAARRRVPWPFVVPALALYAFIIIVPSAQGVTLSFTNWDGLSKTRNWIGLGNYKNLITDPIERAVVIRTIEMAVAVTVLQTAVGLALALALNGKVRFTNVYRSLFFAPVVITPLVTAFLWKFMLGNGGPVNMLLSDVGLKSLQRPWLGEPRTAFWALVLIIVWQFSGLSMAIFLAGLQGVPPEILDAAEMDGASPLARFRYVTWPMLRPAFTVNSLLILIIGMKIFDQVWVITQGGPGGSTDTIATTMYRQAFVLGKFSYGVTLAVALTIVVAVVCTAQYLLVLRAREK
jgi:raffinose/stachyose/melibiose transport system permease protein